MYEGKERESYYRRIDDGSNPKVAVMKKASEKINKKGTQRNTYNPVTGEIGNFVSGYDNVPKNLRTD
jgi:molybdopterin/thiamine biosynthesis adenylyltransferase